MKTSKVLLAWGALALSCGQTTYQRAARAQSLGRDSSPPSGLRQVQCPTVAPAGSSAFLECERRLRDNEKGTGGSGVSDAPAPSSCADPISANDPEMMRICGLGSLH